MASYRKNDRLAELVREIRVDGRSWVIAMIVCAAFAVLLGVYASYGHKRPNDLVGVVVMVGVFIWAAREWWRLRRMVVYLHEQGLRYDDGTARHEIAWEDVTAIQTQYVPGASKKGVADEGNLVNLLVTFRGGQVSLPHDLHDFRGLVAEMERRTDASWVRVLIATLVHRG